MIAATWTCEACGEARQLATGREATGFDTAAGGHVFHHPPYRVCRCERCGAWQKTARLADGELDRYYALLDPDSFETVGLMPPDRVVVEAATALPAGSRILDYGCGVARTLSRSVGRHECFGVEPSARAAKVAGQRGVKLVDDADLERVLAGSVRLAVLADVYEHLVRPLPAVRRLAACLEPGGALMLLTGCADGVEPAELLPECWYFRVAGHLRMVSDRHLAWLASESGLALESARRMSHYDPAPVRDLLQRFRLWAYAATHVGPPGTTARVVARLPIVGRAARWTNAPAVSSGADHVMAVFRKPGNAIR